MASSRLPLSAYLRTEDFLGALRACRQLGEGTLERLYEQKLDSAVTSIVALRSGQQSEPGVLVACEDRRVFRLSDALVPMWTKTLDATADSLVLVKEGGQLFAAAGCSDGNVRLLSCRDGGLLDETNLKAGDVRALSCLNAAIIAGTRSGSVFRLERDGRKTKFNRLFESDGVRSLWAGRLGGDASIVLGTYRGSVEVWDARGHKLAKHTLPIASAREADQLNNWVRAIAVVPVGKVQRILAGSENDTVTAFNYERGTLAMEWRYHSAAWVFSLESSDLNGDGKDEVVVGTWDGTLHILSETGRLLWVVDAADRVFSLRAARTSEGEPRLLVGLSNGSLYSVKPDNRTVIRATKEFGRITSEFLDYLKKWPLTELKLESLSDARCVLHGLARFHEARLWPLHTDSYERTLWQALLFLIRLTGQRLIPAGRVKTGNWVTSLGTVDVDGDDRPEIIAASADGEVRVLRLDGSSLGQPATLKEPIVSVAALAAARSDVCVAATSDGRLFEVTFGQASRNNASPAPPTFKQKAKLDFAIRDFQPRHAGRRSTQCVIASEGGLYQWNDTKFELLLEGNFRRAHSSSGDRLLLGLDGERVMCCSYAAPRSPGISVIWDQNLGAGEISALSVSEDTAFVGTTSGYLFALSLTDGALQWIFKADGEITTLVATSGRLFAGSNDSCVYCFGFDGDLQWMRRMNDWVQSAVHIPAGGGQPDELLVVGSADRNVHILQLNPTVDPLLEACWTSLQRCGRNLETLLRDAEAQPELPRLFALSRITDKSQFERHSPQFWRLLESTEPAIRPLLVAFLPKIAAFLSQQDWERLLEHLLATTADSAVLVELMNALAALEDDTVLRWDSLLKHYQGMPSAVRYRVLQLASKRYRAGVEGFLRYESENWLRVKVLTAPGRPSALSQVFVEANNVLAEAMAREHISQELQLLRARSALKETATFSATVLLSARREFDSRFNGYCKQLSVVICGSVARLQAIKAVSDPDFFILVDDRAHSTKRAKQDLLAEAVKLLIDAATWLESTGLVINARETSARVRKLSHRKESFAFGKFPTVILLSELLTSFGSNKESVETVTRRLTIATESECLWNPEPLTDAKHELEALWGIQKNLSIGRRPEQFETNNKQWWQAVQARELKADVSVRSMKNSIKVKAYRTLSYYSVQIPLDVALKRKDSQWFMRVLERSWIARLASAVDAVQMPEAEQRLATIFDRAEDVVTLLRNPAVEREFSEGTPSAPRYGMQAATGAGSQLETALEELSKYVAGATIGSDAANHSRPRR